jgi:tRNA(fMet)-specific endonuclease VapC
MAARYLLDTDICIYIRQRRPSGLVRRFEELTFGDARISAITFGELRYGAERMPDRERRLEVLNELLQLLPVLELPADAGAEYGSIRAALEREGNIIGNNDLWIAAHARAAGLTLVTNNEREFRRVPGLRVENWASD